MAATVQDPHRGVTQDAAIALQMLEGDLGVVPSVVQIDR
jgi:hypothetical protein